MISATDVFVSYKAEDRVRLLPLVEALQAEGFRSGGTAILAAAHTGARTSRSISTLRNASSLRGAVGPLGPQGISFATRQTPREGAALICQFGSIPPNPLWASARFRPFRLRGGMEIGRIRYSERSRRRCGAGPPAKKSIMSRHTMSELESLAAHYSALERQLQRLRRDWVAGCCLGLRQQMRSGSLFCPSPTCRRPTTKHILLKGLRRNSARRWRGSASRSSGAIRAKR